MNFPKWFAKWRYQLAHEAWHEHMASCWTCEQDKDCSEINELSRQCDYWHLKAYGYERVGNGSRA